MPAPPHRLLHVAQPTTGGVARCVVDLAVAQAAAGLDVHVACPPDGELEPQLAAGGVVTHAWPAGRSPGPATAAEVRRLGSVVRRVDPDLVHLHSAKAGLAGRLLLRGRRPTVFQPHAWSFEAVRGPVRAATLAWERAAARWTSLLICVSRAEQQAGQAAGVHPPRSVVVPNGVDLRRLSPADATDRARARAQLGVTGPLAVCLGRLTVQKGQDRLLAAWPSVLREVGDARLALVGAGPQEARLRARAGPQVVLAGPTRDPAGWLAAADVVAVPSRWEGMALVPLEAMARARSVVVSDVAGMREAVPPEAGAVVDGADRTALAAALTARLGGAVDADAEGLAGRAHVERHHDLRGTLERLTAAYTQAYP